MAAATTGEQLTIFRPPAGDEDIVRVMDRKQEAFAKSLGTGHRIIRGVAGSGKTLVLVSSQMTYHHVAQGEMEGEPWMVTF